MRTFILSAAMAMVFSACGAASDTSATTTAPASVSTSTSIAADMSLEGIQWELLTYGLEAKPQSASQDRTATIVFDDGEVSGMAPCNSYSGVYDIRGEEISVEIEAVTRVSCADKDLDAQEVEFFEALGNALRYDIIGNRMKIEYGQGLSLVFDAG